MKLSDMCIMFEDGDWIESKDQSDDGIRLLQTGNIGEGKFLEKEGKERFISRETFEKLKCKEVFSGDILISRLPEPVGRACLVPEKKQRMITAVDCTICRIDDKKIRRRYLCYYLQSANYYTQLKNSITGTTRKRISRKNLGNIEIKIPNDKKQEEVIKQLDLIVEIIDNKKKKLQLLDTLVKSRFVEMFGDPILNDKNWKLTNMKAVCLKITDGEHGSVPRTLNGHPFLNAKHVKSDGTIDWKNVTYTSSEVHEKIYKRCNPQAKDILMTTTGTIGNIAIVPEIEPFSMDRGITLLKLNLQKVNPIFVAWLLRFDSMQNIMKANVHASAIGHLFLNKVEKLPVILVDIELQNQFADFVASIDKSK